MRRRSSWCFDTATSEAYWAAVGSSSHASTNFVAYRASTTSGCPGTGQSPDAGYGHASADRPGLSITEHSSLLSNGYRSCIYRFEWWRVAKDMVRQAIIKPRNIIPSRKMDWTAEFGLEGAKWLIAG
jgi:hypothetical protein